MSMSKGNYMRPRDNCHGENILGCILDGNLLPLGSAFPRASVYSQKARFLTEKIPSATF